jgi:chemotaxis protein CheD
VAPDAKAQMEIKKAISHCLPEFLHINHYWERENQRVIAKILPGEFYVSTHGLPIATTLGSCVSACIWDKVNGVGGMNHFMLPLTTQAINEVNWGKRNLVSDATRYGNFAMEHLINTILTHGGQRKNLQAKVFGGAQVLQQMSNIGQKNINFVLSYLHTEHIAILSEDLGSEFPRKVIFEPNTGRAFVKKIDKLYNDTITRRETDYGQRIENDPVDGEIELF